MMTTPDKTLLELAAKAAGIQLGVVYKTDVKQILWDCSDEENHKPWNPLTDDGDALRLAVKLRLHITVWPDAIGIGTNGRGYEELKWTDDPYAATRRAIVRAAAQIGESL